MWLSAREGCTGLVISERGDGSKPSAGRQVGAIILQLAIERALFFPVTMSVAMMISPNIRNISQTLVIQFIKKPCTNFAEGAYPKIYDVT